MKTKRDALENNVVYIAPCKAFNYTNSVRPKAIVKGLLKKTKI